MVACSFEHLYFFIIILSSQSHEKQGKQNGPPVILNVTSPQTLDSWPWTDRLHKDSEILTKQKFLALWSVRVAGHSLLL